MEQECDSCLQYEVCKVREYFLSGKTPADEFIKLVAEDSESYVNIRSAIGNILGENCQFYAVVKDS